MTSRITLHRSMQGASVHERREAILLVLETLCLRMRCSRTEAAAVISLATGSKVNTVQGWISFDGSATRDPPTWTLAEVLLYRAQLLSPVRLVGHKLPPLRLGRGSACGASSLERRRIMQVLIEHISLHAKMTIDETVDLVARSTGNRIRTVKSWLYPSQTKAPHWSVIDLLLYRAGVVAFPPLVPG